MEKQGQKLITTETKKYRAESRRATLIQRGLSRVVLANR